MKNKCKLIWIVFLSVVLACGLVASPSISFSLQSYVEGIWVPTDYTLEFMKQSGYEFSAHSIEFMSDGTIVMTNIPSEWIFNQESSSMDFYSGVGTWSVLEETTSLNDLRLSVHISTTAGDEADIELGTVLDYLQFVPANNPEEVHWVTFQICYPHLHITDKILEPLAKALSQSKRDSLGFSPITPEDRIEIDGTIGTTDISLQAYSDFSSHGIFFTLEDDQYIWVHEQESFTGPEKWVDHDAATWEETITLQYQTEARNGGPLNELMIDYMGHDPRLINRSNNWYLSNHINVVLPILDEWRQWRAKEPPSPQSLCP